MSIPVVLGSASPRRAKILRGLGCAFEVCAADAEEIHDAADPVRTVVANALEKHRACRRLRPDAALITADTLVWFEGRLIGKPRDMDEAARFLREFSGRTQVVYTAVALGLPSGGGPRPPGAADGERCAVRARRSRATPEGATRTMACDLRAREAEPCACPEVAFHPAEPDIRVEASSVRFKRLSEETIQTYLDRTRPLDRAGAYDIDENGDLLIAGISGSYTNVMGLPEAPVRDWLLANRLM
jgi:septum formation protein